MLDVQAYREKKTDVSDLVHLPTKERKTEKKRTRYRNIVLCFSSRSRYSLLIKFSTACLIILGSALNLPTSCLMTSLIKSPYWNCFRSFITRTIHACAINHQSNQSNGRDRQSELSVCGTKFKRSRKLTSQRALRSSSTFPSVSLRSSAVSTLLATV